MYFCTEIRFPTSRSSRFLETAANYRDKKKKKNRVVKSRTSVKPTSSTIFFPQKVFLLLLFSQAKFLSLFKAITAGSAQAKWLEWDLADRTLSCLVVLQAATVPMLVWCPKSSRHSSQASSPFSGSAIQCLKFIHTTAVFLVSLVDKEGRMLQTWRSSTQRMLGLQSKHRTPFFQNISWSFWGWKICTKIKKNKNTQNKTNACA